MRVFFQIAYFSIGIVQFFAVWDGSEYFLGSESFFSRMFAFFVSLFLTLFLCWGQRSVFMAQSMYGTGRSQNP